MGAQAPLQVIDAYNAGDGELALDVRTSAAWIQVSLGEARECDRGTCYPVRIQATTAGLETGRHTGVVTVLAPGALDAPQTVTVTLDAGGAVPKAIQFTVRPGGTDSTTIRTSNEVSASAATQSGGNWLSLPAQAVGSFRFSSAHQVDAKHLDGMANGEYTGRVDISASPIADENRSVPVSLKVTDGPIMSVGATRLDVRLVAGAAVYGQGIGVSNRGAGSLTLEAPAGSAAWISGDRLAENQGVLLKLDPKDLSPGFYRGELEIKSNAANSPQRVEVALEVVAQGEPWIQALSLGDRITVDPVTEIAPGMLLTVRGEQLTLKPQAGAESLPWPQELAGARLLVNGTPAALEFVSATEIRFQAPFGLEPGEATLEIERDGTKGNRLAVDVQAAAPRIVSFSFEDGSAIGPDKPVKAGDRVLILATGLGKTDPPVDAGAAPPDGAKTVEAVTVSFSGGPFAPRVIAEAEAGPKSDQPGVYRVRVVLPEGIPASDFVEMRIAAGGVSSNRTTLAVR